MQDAAGSAIEALPHMNSLLNARPDGFDSMEEAIEWQSENPIQRLNEHNSQRIIGSGIHSVYHPVQRRSNTPISVAHYFTINGSLLAE
uniref:Uncharacterized protein n=1 Tax=Psilocybe cubensis TaxID=181762 RepID=A0A8H8CF80_PSICU